MTTYSSVPGNSLASRKPWLVFQNLWGHDMRGVDPGWLVSNLFQPLQLHVFRDSSHHVEATTVAGKALSAQPLRLSCAR